MNVAGIDVSTRAVDIVKLPFDNDQAAWDRYELPGQTWQHRVGLAPDHLPGGTYWDDVALVAIERPYGLGRDTLFALHTVVGCVIAALPARLRPPWLLHPAEWRKACGMSGNAIKEDITFFSEHAASNPTQDWPQDAHDAHAIAYAARNINEKGVAA